MPNEIEICPVVKEVYNHYTGTVEYIVTDEVFVVDEEDQAWLDFMDEIGV